MLFGGKAHQNEIADLVAFTESQTGGVQAFKDQLRIIVLAQTDIDNLQFCDGGIQIINGDFFLLDAGIEIVIVDGQVRVLNVLIRVFEQLPEGGAVVFNRLELDPRLILLPFINQIGFIDLIRQVSLCRLYNAGLHQVVHCQHQQGDRGEPLLPVDDQVFVEFSVAVNGDKASEKVAAPPLADDRDQIIIQLLAILNPPVVVSLIYRDNEPLVRTLHIGHQFSL